MQIGLVMPTVGLKLFVSAGVSHMSLEEVIRASLPWLLLISYVPWSSLVIPNLLLD